MRRFQISGSFYCLLALIIFLDIDHLFLYFLLAAVVHECGHLAAIYLCGAVLLQFRLSAVGGTIRYYLPNSSKAKEVLIALSGCFLGGGLAYTAAILNVPLLCGASTLLTGFNLLPISFLDGGRALRILIGENSFLNLLQYFTVSLMICLGVLFAVRWNGFGLLMISVILAFRQQSGLRKKQNTGMI